MIPNMMIPVSPRSRCITTILWKILCSYFLIRNAVFTSSLFTSLRLCCRIAKWLPMPLPVMIINYGKCECPTETVSTTSRPTSAGRLGQGPHPTCKFWGQMYEPGHWILLFTVQLWQAPSPWTSSFSWKWHFMEKSRQTVLMKASRRNVKVFNLLKVRISII